VTSGKIGYSSTPFLKKDKWKKFIYLIFHFALFTGVAQSDFSAAKVASGTVGPQTEYFNRTETCEPEEKSRKR
jgi:hypothetical protein